MKIVRTENELGQVKDLALSINDIIMSSIISQIYGLTKNYTDQDVILDCLDMEDKDMFLDWIFGESNEWYDEYCEHVRYEKSKRKEKVIING
jgi:hypothetical protein